MQLHSLVIPGFQLKNNPEPVILLVPALLENNTNHQLLFRLKQFT